MIPNVFLMGSQYGSPFDTAPGTPARVHVGVGTAAPVRGYFLQGSMIWNVGVALGQPNGWRCTVAGTPGTWVAMANL